MPNVVQGHVPFIFDGTKTGRDLTGYALFRGVTDWADLYQFNQFESGYGLFIVLKIPKFLEVLKTKNEKYNKLIDTYVHILEYEFRSFDGIDNLQSEVSELTNGVRSISVITKSNFAASSSQFSLRYFEKSGSIINKVHELFLRGIKDPATQVKHYHGLIESGELEAGFENEVFSFLYIVTDNTLMNVEKAFYIVAAQPTNADLNIYNIERGDIQFKEISCEFSGLPIMNTAVNQKAQQLLDWVRKGTCWDESKFTYSGVENMTPYHRTLVGGGTGNTGNFVDFKG